MTTDFPALTQANNNNIRLRFINDNEIRTLNAEHAAKHRRCLFSDEERQQMSDELTDSVTSRAQDPGQILLDLEQDCLDDSPEQRPFSVFRGPFGVARWESDDGQDQDGIDSNVPVDADLDIDVGDVLDPDEVLSRWLLGTGECEEDLIPIPQIQETGDRDPSPGLLSRLCPVGETIFDDLELDLNSPLAWPTQPQQESSSPSPRSINVVTNDDPKSWLLLSYYRDRIIRLISPLPRQQQQHHNADATGSNDNDPWSSLVMPCAMTTMAELTIGGAASHARLALLNALLATSAFHLHASSKGVTAEEWMVFGDGYTVNARRHLEGCLEEVEVDVHGSGSGSVRKRSKYKEVLMAMLCLANAFMVKGDPDTRLTYLLHAERFIRANGFKKPALSRKRRTLHHCYAYMRIMAETTRSSIYYLPDTDSLPHRNRGHDGHGYGQAGSATTSDNDEFRVSRWTALSDNMMGMEKDPDTAKRDLHLEIPGRWTSTLFPELYGIAEGFLVLLSQVIRLANERDLAMEREDHFGAAGGNNSGGGGGGGGLGLREFTLRAKALEKSIYRLISSGADIDNAMVQSMYTALLIFFYRRVHNLDAMLLQREVLAVQGYLSNLQQQHHHHNHAQKPNEDTDTARTVVALVWPAFVAACEALLPESQGYFADWFEGMVERTGLVSVRLAKGVCEFIWAKRRENEDGVSWPEVLRGRGFKVLCT